MKILLAVDGSDCTRRVLSYIAAHDELRATHHVYSVVHCVAAVPHRAAAFLDPGQARKYYDADAALVFEPVRAFFATQGIGASFVLRIGQPAKNIAKLAERGRFDLLIMGSHGHGAAAGLVLGSVATKVLSLCSTPALLIP